MKKKMQKFLSLILCVVFVVGVLPLNVSAKTITQYNQGDIIEFGWYPQSEVTDTTITDRLNAQAPDWDNWTSYGYYSGSGEKSDGQMVSKNYMRYVDVTLNGNKYRGVKFTAYRPNYTGYTSLAQNSYQDDNGYNTDSVYWFQFTHLRWRVLDSVTGLVLSENIIDSQPYNNYIVRLGSNYYGDVNATRYACNYAESSIRQWLNDDFYKTAFAADQQNLIETSVLENKVYMNYYPQYSSASTNDKIFFLTFDDIGNRNYGFSSDKTKYDINRRTSGTDYAKCQDLSVMSSTSKDYLDVNEKCCSAWWLRSAGGNSYSACSIYPGGYVSYGDSVYKVCIGVRPALRLNLSAEILQSDSVQGEQNHTYKEEVKQPTCTTEGYTTYTCKTCGYSYQDNRTAKLSHTYESYTTWPTCIAHGFTTHTCSACGDSYVDGYMFALGHDYGPWMTTTPATCTEDGTMIKSCTRCENALTTTIEKTGHRYNSFVTAPTCTEQSYITYICSKCPYSYKEPYADALGHDYKVTVVAPTKEAAGYTRHACTRCENYFDDTPVSPLPTVSIVNFKSERKAEYRDSIQLTATVKNEVSGATIHWFVDGKDTGKTGNTYTHPEAKKSYTIVAKYMKDGKVLDETESETVTVNTSFFAKLKAFFKYLFKKSIPVAQAYLGLEKVK